MATVRIFFGTKFCQTHLDSIITNNWVISFDEKTEIVIFDLSLLEWINTEEIAFLFAWIRNAVLKEKKVEVWLPYTYDIFKNPSRDFDKNLLNAYLEKSGEDNEDRIGRRRGRNIFLLSVWGLLENVSDKVINYKHIADGYESKRQSIVEKYSHLVIPFTAIGSDKPTSPVSNTFTDVINGGKTKNLKQPVGPFDLNPTIVKRLETFNCYSPFESKIISHVITKELFANSLIHANISNKNQGIEECYFALSLHNEWEDFKAKGQNFINQFVLEKDSDTLDFYKDKVEILKDVKQKAEKFNAGHLLAYSDLQEADLSKYQKDFKNKSFLEFTFLDFGDGIYETLDKKFQDYIKVEENKKTFKTIKPETQILEYAFYSESSRNQYDARLEHPELFPRGLYFLIDMVRRYKGLLVMRSGKGKIVYDFSDKIYLRKQSNKIAPFLEATTTVREAIRVIKTENATYDGTMVSIVLPEKRKEELSYEPVRADNKELYRDIYLSKTDSENLPSVTFKPESYEYINMLFLYERVITTIKPKELEKAKGFDSYIYIELLSELKKHSLKKCIIFIDFEFYPRTDNIQQLLFYLTNSPFINEYAKAVIINLVDETKHKDEELKKEVYSVLKEFKINLFAKDNEPHIFRPIPCINFDLYQTDKLVIKDINWIGVKSALDEIQLDSLFLGDISQLMTKKLLNNKSLGGSVFADNNNFKYAIFTTSLELVEKFKEARQNAIIKLINALITDGSKPIADFKKKGIKEHFIFQASKGSFQTKYLSLYETLHNKYLAKYLAKKLLDKYIAKIKDKPNFNKIITVTVSSQLIGVAIRDLIKEEPEYHFLKTGKDDTMESCPSLIMLSSYYSFEDEKPFTKIKADDNVLIVNDVISTGSLVHKLLQKIRKKNAIVTGVMSIADCRIQKMHDDEEDDCEFELLKDEPLFTLVGYPKENDIEIRKYKKKEFAIKALNKDCGKNLVESNIDVKRINPLLNTVVELSDEYAEKQRILFENPKELLPTDEKELKLYQDKFFKIGHFEQNISHNGYLTNMKTLFSNDEGLRIIKEIKHKIDSEYQTKLYNRNIDDATKLFSIISLAGQIENVEIANAISTEMRQVLDTLINEPSKPHSKKYSYKPDFIFYPIFSGIENFSHDQFHEVFNTDYENIIGLQRFDTDKGWRFPFPPKRFNNITKGKHILIFDSGALTGESLVQMIDSVSFLDVARIDVISVVGRIEDYNREFFSRIKSLKVKTLHDEYFDESIERFEHKQEIVRNKVSFANLNIIFGINFHIPVFSSKSSCPFCEELSELYSFQDISKPLFPPATKSYIEKRIKEIGRIDLNHEPNSPTPEYIPYEKLYEDDETKEERKQYDIVSIFLMRDKLGKIDSYRFYKEYYKPFDEDIIKHLDGNIYEKKDVLKQIELILICILHEPKLFKVHKDLLVNIHDKCEEIILDIIFDDATLEKLNFKWSKYSIVRLFLLYFRKALIDQKEFERLFVFIGDDEDSLNYLSFVFQQTLKSLASEGSRSNEPFFNNLVAIDDDFDKGANDCPIYSNQGLRDVIKNLTRYIHPATSENVLQAFFNMKMFFKNTFPNADHIELRSLFVNFKSETNTYDYAEWDSILKMSGKIIQSIKTNLIVNLRVIKSSAKLKEAAEEIYKELFDSDECIYKTFGELESAYESMKTVLENSLSKAEDKVEKVNAFRDILLDKMNSKYLQDKKDFNVFCNKYEFDLKECIESALKDGKYLEYKALRRGFKLINNIDKSITVPGHYDFIHVAFVEILRNAAKRPENNEATLTISCIIDESDSVPRIIFDQSTCVVKNESKHVWGTEKVIPPIFEVFCGANGYYIEKDETKPYTIWADFNNSSIKLTEHR